MTACARPGGQCDHHRLVTHVVRHEMKTRPKLLGRLFFGTQEIVFCATQTVGKKHRVRCSALVLPKHFLYVISSSQPAQGVKQHPSLDTFMPKRNATSFPNP